MSKNQLQEYCQKNKIALPVYSFVQQDLNWICTGKVMDYSATSFPAQNKTEASMIVAKLLLEKLEAEQVAKANVVEEKASPARPTTSPARPPSLTPVVIVDLENMPLKLDKNENAIFMLFCSSFSTIDFEKYKQFNIYKIDSAITEATDHFISYTIGRMVGNKAYQPDKNLFIVCSKDKSSAIVVSLLQKDGFTVFHCRSQNDYDRVWLTDM